MAPINRNGQTTGGGNSALQEWLYRESLKNFEPHLHFYEFGVKPIVDNGYNTVAWARFSKLASSAVTTGTTSDDGVTPSDTAITVATIKATPVQYRIVARAADMVVQLNAVAFVKGMITEINSVMARKIDEVIQTEVMAGSNVRYAGSATARDELTATDVLKANHFNVANGILAGKSAPTFDGYYVAIAHPFCIADLRKETGTGSWLDTNKYMTPDKIFRGEIGMLNGVRVTQSAHVQEFAAAGAGDPAIDVYPTLVIGQGAYGVTSFQSLRTYVVPATASDSDPTAQRTSVGSKIAFVAKRLQEDAILRFETAATVL